MSTHRNSKTLSVATQLAQLSVAVPQVVGHRVARMAMAGTSLSERDRKEFQGMVDEKTTAFTQAFTAMAAQTMRANQSLATSIWGALWSPSHSKSPSPAAWAALWQDASFGVLAQGIAPVHRKAVANAKRLARTRLR